MNDELELLRAVVRAVVIERRAWARFNAATRPGPADPKDRAPFDIVEFFDCQKATDLALTRLAEVNPGLVYG